MTAANRFSLRRRSSGRSSVCSRPTVRRSCRPGRRRGPPLRTRCAPTRGCRPWSPRGCAPGTEPSLSMVYVGRRGCRADVIARSARDRRRHDGPDRPDHLFRRADLRRLRQLQHRGEQVRLSLVGHAEDRRYRGSLLIATIACCPSHARCWIAPLMPQAMYTARDDLAGLADLPIVGRVAGIDRGALAPSAAPSLSATWGSHLVELVAAAERAAAADDLAAVSSGGRSSRSRCRGSGAVGWRRWRSRSWRCRRWRARRRSRWFAR